MTDLLTRIFFFLKVPEKGPNLISLTPILKPLIFDNIVKEYDGILDENQFRIQFLS